MSDPTQNAEMPIQVRALLYYRRDIYNAVRLGNQLYAPTLKEVDDALDLYGHVIPEGQAA